MEGPRQQPCSIIVADYNPSVLQLVTLPNFILTWALAQRQNTPALSGAFSIDGEIELLPGVIEAFKEYLANSKTKLSFLSGAWSEDFVNLLYSIPEDAHSTTLLLGAETIYSPFALQAYTETTFSILLREQARQSSPPATALVGAKKMYFGVGGSLDDFVDQARQRGGKVTTLREEAGGVRRGVVRCVLHS
jgi:protein-histidine N-methyltransferase